MLAQVAGTSYAPLGELGPGIAGSTLVVLALITATLLALRVLAGRRRGRARSNATLQLVTQLELSASQTLYLIRAGGRCLLIGGTPSGLALLSELDPAALEIAEKAQPAPGTRRREDGPAGALLQRLRSRLSGASGQPPLDAIAAAAPHAAAGWPRDVRPGS